MSPAETIALGPGYELCGGRYRIESRIGHGGMASVWLGHDERLDRPVAIKVLADNLATDPEFVTRFRREARIAARLSHPNLVKVFDFDPGERPALIMEYIEGGTLDQITGGGASSIEPEALATQLLGALEHIHGAGIVHRDVKPQNVLIDDDGRAMLTDFGIAQPQDATSITKTGLVIGTKDYMAPEVQEGERATPQSDLYSTGRVLGDHLDNDSSESLRRLVERLTEPDPALRPPSAKRALAYLSGGFTPGEPAAVTTQPMEALEPVREPQPRREYAIDIRHVLAGLALLAAAVAAIAIATNGGDEPAADPPTEPAAIGSDEPAAENPPSADEPTPAPPAGGESPAPAEGVVPEPKPNADPAKGAELEQAAFETLQSGDAEKAVKDYEKALAGFPLEARTPEAFGQYPNYAYALYSYGDALLQAGRPDEAVAVLEERLAFDDQREAVETLLAEAQAAAGE